MRCFLLIFELKSWIGELNMRYLNYLSNFCGSTIFFIIASRSFLGTFSKRGQITGGLIGPLVFATTVLLLTSALKDKTCLELRSFFKTGSIFSFLQDKNRLICIVIINIFFISRKFSRKFMLTKSIRYRHLVVPLKNPC